VKEEPPSAAAPHLRQDVGARPVTQILAAAEDAADAARRKAVLQELARLDARISLSEASLTAEGFALTGLLLGRVKDAAELPAVAMPAELRADASLAALQAASEATRLRARPFAETAWSRPPVIASTL
jgi:hypothetical protein